MFWGYVMSTGPGRLVQVEGKLNSLRDKTNKKTSSFMQMFVAGRKTIQH